jgi:hypothetical protein
MTSGPTLRLTPQCSHDKDSARPTPDPERRRLVALAAAELKHVAAGFHRPCDAAPATSSSPLNRSLRQSTTSTVRSASCQDHAEFAAGHPESRRCLIAKV